jgi:hypothetical protein
MNSLEDAYVNIAKAEEKLHQERNPELLLEKQNIIDENDPDFKRYLNGQSNPEFGPQVKAVMQRRFY